MQRVRRATIWTLLLLLVLLPLPPAAAQTPAVFQLNRSSVDLTLELGSQADVVVRVTNRSSSPRAARIVSAPFDTAAAAARGPQPLPLPRQAARLAPELARLAADQPVAMIVYFSLRPDLNAVANGADWNARGDTVFTLLNETAQRNQAAVRALLTARGISFRPLWIANALALTAPAGLAAELAARPDVALVSPDRRWTPPPPPAARAVSGCAPTADNVCWNIAAIGAQRVWQELAVRGAGITVATIDSGASYLHPALNTAYRGRQADGSYQHAYNWFDAAGDSAVPVDSAGHGTHVLGTMVGAAADRPAFGVAPDAEWIAARACLVTCSEADLIAAAQWLLAPTLLDGSAARPDLRPHVINNSWGYDVGGERFYDGYVAAWRAAGIFPVFAAGNLSALDYPIGNLAGCGTVASPGDSPLVTAVGALDSDGRLAEFSRIGPSPDGVLKPDISAPGSGISSSVGNSGYQVYSGTSMAAPHVAAAVALLWSANPALIGDLERTYQLLTGSARRVTDDARYSGAAHQACPISAYPNNIYGYGRLDAYTAVLRARPQSRWLQHRASLAQLPPGASTQLTLTVNAAAVPGAGVYETTLLVYPVNFSGAPARLTVRLTVPSRPEHVSLHGTLRDAESGTALRGTLETAGGARVLTDAAGVYQLQLPPQVTHRLTATALGYAPSQLEFSAAAGADAEQDLLLARRRAALTTSLAQPQLTATLTEVTTATLLLTADGNSAVSYRLEREFEPYGVWRSDEADLVATGWIEPPVDRQVLTLADDGVSEPIALPFSLTFGDYTSNTLRVSANGVAAFGRISHDFHTPGCFPLPETFGPAVAVLRADLDPSQGGEVSVAVLAEGVLVSWADVPLFDAAAAEPRRISAQLLIQPAGGFVLNYRSVAALTAADDLTIGVQDAARQAQSLVCNADWPTSAVLGDDLRIELRPQPLSADWLRWTAPEQSTLLPAQQAAVTLRARLMPGFDGTRRARLRVVSDDHDLPQRHVVVTVSQPPPPFRLLLSDVRR
jgi:subtilisin family serine protease